MFRVLETKGIVICMTEPPVTPDYSIENNIPVWQDFVETDRQPTIDRARELVIGEGQSVFLQGFGGTGRTYAAKQIAKELLEQTMQLVCTVYTHMAARNIAMPGAINGTLHHCLHKLPALQGIDLIDEVSRIPLVLWAAILKWQLLGAKCICLGDFRSQFGPAFNRWRKTSIDRTMEYAHFSSDSVIAIR